MKKIAFVLALVMMLSVFAACGKASTETTAPETTAPETTVPETTEMPTEPEVTGEPEFEMPEADAELSEMFDKLYTNVTVELPVITMPVDLADEYNRTTYLGGAAAEGIDAAAFSESMMGAQGYSISLVRCADADTAKAVAQTMFDNIDTRKWICVEATDKQAASFENYALFIMVDPELGVTDEQLMTGFSTVFGGEIENIIK